MTLTATASEPAHHPHSDANFVKARFNMVEAQIRTNRVSDERLLIALSEIPRQVFVPGPMAAVAYVDTSVRIGSGRYLMEPLFLARLLQEAAVDPGDRVLIVGAGTGYSAAVAAALGAEVIAVESEPELAATARATLAELSLGAIRVETGPAIACWPAGGPYDVILIDGMIAALPEAIPAQLAERGRLVTIESQDSRCGAGRLYRKVGGFVSGRNLFDATIPYLPGFEPRPAFVL